MMVSHEDKTPLSIRSGANRSQIFRAVSLSSAGGVMVVSEGSGSPRLMRSSRSPAKILRLLGLRGRPNFLHPYSCCATIDFMIMAWLIDGPKSPVPQRFQQRPTSKKSESIDKVLVYSDGSIRQGGIAIRRYPQRPFPQRISVRPQECLCLQRAPSMDWPKSKLPMLGNLQRQSNSYKSKG